MPSTIRLHRILRCPPDRLYRALTDPRALAKWIAPHGFYCEVHSCDSRPGGAYRMSFVNMNTGAAHTFGGVYAEMIPGEKLRYTDRFDDPNLPGQMGVTYTLKKVSCGTELSIVQEGIPDVIPPEMCYLGWQESLNQLAALVEPEIP